MHSEKSHNPPTLLIRLPNPRKSDRKTFVTNTRAFPTSFYFCHVRFIANWHIEIGSVQNTIVIKFLNKLSDVDEK